MRALSITPAPHAPSAMPPSATLSVSYWELQWNELHRAGWSLVHTTYTNATGRLRQRVQAVRNGEMCQVSAPTLAAAVEALLKEVSSPQAMAQS